MDSSKTFDDVIMYLEKIISDGCDIDYNEISKITMSPAALFQRIFIFVSGISISDYVRKRRLTIAGHELKNNDISILDIAIKYGFQSHFCIYPRIQRASWDYAFTGKMRVCKTE
ncbi:MAG: hypothetical protein LBQ71_19480 [Hungatella sp.]|jgi:AraC family transcriptional regulator|nr:hypothetical protein [Hungatella sp.]